MTYKLPNMNIPDRMSFCRAESCNRQIMLKGRQRMAISVKKRMIAKTQKSGPLLMHTGGSLKAKAGVHAAEIGRHWKRSAPTAMRHHKTQHVPTIEVASRNFGTVKIRR